MSSPAVMCCKLDHRALWTQMSQYVIVSLREFTKDKRASEERQTALKTKEVRLQKVGLWVRHDPIDTDDTEWEGISQSSLTPRSLPYHSREVRRLPQLDKPIKGNKDLDDIGVCVKEPI